MHYARTENNIVAQVMRVDPNTIFDASFAALFLPCGEEVQPGWLWDGEAFTAPPEPQVDRTALALSIDEAVGTIYDRYTRYEPEYTAREAQALSYQAAGYSGAVPAQVAAFATPSGKTPTEAANIIITQSSQLRGALSQLGVLRMRKYEVLRAATDAQATAAHASVLATVQAIGQEIA